MSRSIKELFWEDMPRGYMRDLRRGLPDAFRNAHDDTLARKKHPWAINLIPFECRANCHELSCDVAEFYPGQVKAEPIQGEADSKNWWFYSKITAGRIIMTIVSASDPNELVRPSNARLQYSRSNYRYLLPELEPPPISDDWHVCAYLLVGHLPKNHRDLEFAMVRFPLPENKGYYGEQINLLTEFPDEFGLGVRRADDPLDGGDSGAIIIRDKDHNA